MKISNSGEVGEVTMNEMLSVLKTVRATEVAIVLGKLVGMGLFAILVYSYCSVLIEAGVRGVR
ncbi:MAG: hypothetical protein H7X95_05835 [Deltaproteobacteria bacterium]|nr:hypothetical protein [Deltaproteobacteria bacterium]